MTTTMTTGVRMGASVATNAREAVAELARELVQPDMRLVVFHCSPRYDRDELTSALKECFHGVPVIGCTTAGEITPIGYRDGSLTGVSLAGEDFAAETVLIDSLKEFEVSRGRQAGLAVRNALQKRGLVVGGKTTFGFMLIDGLSVREEGVVGSLYQSLGDIEMVGGSAGDETNFGTTWVYHDGRFHTDAAVFALIHTTRPFRVFQTQHFDFAEGRMVVTEAITEQRIVTEINGYPAGREYAKVVGLEVKELTPMIFAAHPVVVRINGKPFVRSIQKVNPDESLTFFCGIDEGMVLTVAKGVDMTARLRAAFQQVEGEIGRPDLVLGCDCILRYLEMQQKNLTQEISELLNDYNVVGFSTYGEQYNGMHVNQTFTGVAIARRSG